MHGMPSKEEYFDPTYPSPSNSHWFPWLTKQLMVHDICTVAPEIPQPWQPRYDIWRKEFERFDITPETILIGHSCGGGFIVRWLSENKDWQVGKVILVAPWLNPDNDPRSDTADFFDFTVDPDLRERTKGVTIFHSDNDSEAIHKSVKMLRDAIRGHNYKEFHQYGHFCIEDMKTTEFPELLQAILEK